MARKEFFVEGDWNAICDVCGFKFKAADLRLRWDGLRVCDRDYETRHPQDLPWRIPKEQMPQWTRPSSDGPFVGIINPDFISCPVHGYDATAGIAIVGCAVVGRSTNDEGSV